MTSLAGRTLIDTYKDLLQISNNNSGVDATARYIEDGEGTPSILSLSTTNVGIGTTNPSGSFEVQSERDSGDLVKININPSQSGNPAGLHITNTNENLTEASAYLKITDQAGNHKLRVNKSGKVGINTGTPGSILHIDGNGDSDNYSSILKLGNPTWNAAGGCGFSFHKRDSDNWAGMQINTELDDGMAIMIRNTNKAPNPSFGLNGDGLITHCAGINLGSATGASANTLDNYEEGTWTPVIKSGDGAAETTVTLDNSFTQARYTRIGNIVTVKCRVRRNDSTNHTGFLRVTGLPFAPAVYNTSSNNHIIQLGGTMWLDNGQGNDVVEHVYITNGNGLVAPRSGTGATGSLRDRYLHVDELNNDRLIYASAIYYTT